MSFWWESEHRVPADAKAVIVAPSIVADRYIQLTPAYKGGAIMADGAQIPLERTAVPLELDQIYRSLNDLSVALGPKGANDRGALSRLLAVSARNLNGQGAKLNQTITDVSTLTQTLAGNSNQLFTTIRQLQTFVSALAANDAAGPAVQHQLRHRVDDPGRRAAGPGQGAVVAGRRARRGEHVREGQPRAGPHHGEVGDPAVARSW